MDDFDPNVDPTDQDAADAYVDWCATNYERLSQGPARTYRSAVRCGAWLLAVASAQLHLDDEIEHDRQELLEQLASYAMIARAIERQREHYVVERLIVLRASLDCWEPTGEWGGHLLDAAKCAIAALVLIELAPLVDLWELSCPDAWALLDAGTQSLAQINLANELSFADFAVRPAEMTIARYTWQRVNNMVRHVSPPLSEN